MHLLLRYFFALMVCAFLCATLPVYAAADDRRVQLREAVQIGLESNPEYNIAHSRLLASEQRLRQGEALYLPSIDVNGDAGYEYSDDAGTRIRNKDKTLLRRDIGITLTQRLFDGGEAHYEVQRQSHAYDGAEQRLYEAKEIVGFNIVQAYLDVLMQRFLLHFAQENLQQHEKILEQINESVAGGRLTRADSDQVRARVARAQANLADTKEALDTAKARYFEQTGVAPARFVLPDWPYDALGKTVEEAVATAFANSPSLQAIEKDVEASLAQSKGVKSNRYPRVDAQGNARTGHDLGGTRGTDKSASALLVMRWNLYRGGGDLAREREAIYAYEEAKYTQEQVARSIENDIRQSWAALVAARKRQAHYSDQAKANKLVVEAYKDQFQVGRRTLLDVLDAQNEHFVSQSSALSAKLSEGFALYRLLALKGALIASLDIQSPTYDE